ncbi:MAG: twin-arginine translocase TatA/TatE family subunit [Desulfomonile tiedjei]|uniref:Sec-independent protein translocase protein TatA n=1 Tax=Desulfomonile tiedjei TaxID=2358 RepID=A0A9D6V539_9BACT|nr:twin-arginine translocase TatA/TatE family subunit [Desulfomonile tiedjei]
MLGPQELIVILLIAVIIFGGKRIPEIMEGMGKGIRSFKKAMDSEETTPTLGPVQNIPPGQLKALTKEAENK